MNKSVEQVAEEYARNIREMRGKILDDFYIAYAAQLNHLHKDISLQDICLVEQPNFDGKLGCRFWFEYKTKFEDDNL